MTDGARTDSELWVSPSQLDLFDTCQRRWFVVYVERVKEPQAESADRGEKVHLVLENYLNGKGPIDQRDPYGRIAYAGLKYLPEPLSGVTEGEFKFPGGPGFLWNGKIDWRSADWSRIIDHKSTSDFKYAKKEKVLKLDPQALIYVMRAMREHDRPTQQADWIYYRTKGEPDSKLISVTFERSYIQEQEQRLIAHCTDTVFPKRRLTFLDLPPNDKSCYKYNKPCPNRSRCTDLNKSKVFGDIMPSKDELLALLKNKSLAPVGALPPVPVVVQPVVQQAPPVQAPAPVAVVPPVVVQQAPIVLPPQAPPPAPVAAPEPVIPPPAPVGQSPDPAVQQAVAEAHAEAVADIRGERKRGRPPGSKNKARQPITHETAPTVPDPDGGPVSGGIGTLYIDCLPDGEQPETLGSLIALCNEGIKGTLGHEHYSLAPYGSGPAVLAQTLGMILGAYRYETLFVQSGTPDARNALDTLCANAETIIRGFR